MVYNMGDEQVEENTVFDNNNSDWIVTTCKVGIGHHMEVDECEEQEEVKGDQGHQPS
jgi:hypothetical protein